MPFALEKLAIFALTLGLAWPAAGYDRTVSIGESPFSADSDDHGGHGMLITLVQALDKATHSTSRIVTRPFARSLEETAEGLADIHIPLIQNGNAPPPKGLAYVMDVDLGRVPFVIYSLKTHPLTAANVDNNLQIETEPGHESFFSFKVGVTHCVSCSLNKLAAGRIDAMIVPETTIDPLLSNPKYKSIHRALYKIFPVRALVPANADSRASRRYIIDGITALKKTGELAKITAITKPYTDWQP